MSSWSQIQAEAARLSAAGEAIRRDKSPGVPPRRPRRFGTVRLDPIRAGRDMSVVTDEGVKHLTSLPGADVEVSAEFRPPSATE